MPYSTACTTPLSNFEAGLNYKDVKDPAVVVTFPLVDTDGEEEVSLLAWTTTPWTLPSNIALCVHPDMILSKMFPMLSSMYDPKQLIGSPLSIPKFDHTGEANEIQPRLI